MNILQDSKLLFLELSLVKLLKNRRNQKNKFGENIYFPIDFVNILNLDKINLYPFILSTANGVESRKLMFSEVFLDFYSSEKGIIDRTIEDCLPNECNLTFFSRETELEDNFFLNPLFDVIDDKNIFDKKEQELNSIVIDNNSENFKTLLDLLNNAIKNIEINHSNLIFYPYEKILSLNKNHQSWQMLKKISKYNKDEFDFSDEIRNFLIKEKSPFRPQEAS